MDADGAEQDVTNDMEIKTVKSTDDMGEAGALRTSDDAEEPKEQAVAGQDGQDGETETLSTTGRTTTLPDKKKKKRVLQPDEEVLALEDLTPLSTWIYVVWYLAMVLSFFGMLWLSITQVSEPGAFILNVFVLNFIVLNVVTYTAGALNVFAGLKPAYSRKIVHILLYAVGFIFDAVLDKLNDDDAVYALGWGLWNIQWWIIVNAIPTRKAFNKCLGKIDDESNAKWKRYLNYPSLALRAVDRPEDRPNTLRWLQYQMLGGYALFFVFAIIVDAADVIPVETVLVIPSMVVGFGDGLAEPVGRKWGANYQYRTHGCCSEHDYTRSYPGSFMVWLAGVVVVSAYYHVFSTIQLIIALIVIPIVGTVTEAKAPHTLDNPLIIFFVGVSVLLVAAIPL